MTMNFHVLTFLGIILAATCLSTLAKAEGPIALGTRRELLVDDFLLDRVEGQAAPRLHRPTMREIVLVFDQPWEGNSSGAYATVFVDEGRYRLYYQACQQVLKGEPPAHPFSMCYAESTDGIHWVRPKLGTFEFNGSKENNIVWLGVGAEGLSPFKDANPSCAPDARYKAIGAGQVNGANVLVALQSADGLHWSLMQKDPLAVSGAFDSQNLAFWDAQRSEYRLYARDFRDGRRDIITAASKDFLHWTPTAWIDQPGAPPQQLYTNQVQPYYRAPHIFFGFPARYTERGWCDSTEALPELEHRKLRSASSNREGMAVTDGLFMTSRDGQSFHRWDEAFLCPGLRGTDNWVYGDNYVSWGLVETKSANADAPDEISLYATEGYWMGKASKLRRYTMRQDGFVSMHAPFAGGQFTTRPITFQGDRMVLNFATSGAGSIRVEIQDAAGKPLEGFTLDDSCEVFGDSLDRTVTWKHGSDLGKLAGRVVRLRFTLSDADLYGFQFQPGEK
jgi:hypothetical protein